MLNFIWSFMILAGILYGALTGNLTSMTENILDSAGEAVSLCLSMVGIVGFWMGLMEIGQQCGLMDKMTTGIGPFLNFMFPRIPKKHPAREYIATNIIANVLGLGWACTPAGLKAMEELANLEMERGNPEYLQDEKAVLQSADMKHKATTGTMTQGRSASNEMCTFLILNISSLQLIPVNMIAYRSRYGSVNPAVIVAPAIVATAVSTVAAVLYCKIMDWRRRP